MAVLGSTQQTPTNRTIYTSVYTPERSTRLFSDKEIICTRCGYEIPRGQIEGELFTSGISGENARHIFQEGCENAEKRLVSVGKLPEPDLVY